MKIGILTLPFHTNYGGIIQNYALQTVLERMGHEVFTINLCIPEPKFPINKPIIILKRFVKKILGRKDGIIFVEKKESRDRMIIRQRVRRFINENIHLTQKIYTKKELDIINNLEVDAVIVGSDQVWRIPYAYPDIQTYFLDFIKNESIKKLAYSASFGTDELEFSDEQIQDCGELIKDFDFVSVREDAALDLITKKYGWKCKREPVHTLDPTMLLSKNDYLTLSKDFDIDFEGDLFYYILDMTEEKQKILDLLSHDLGYKPFTVKSKKTGWLDNPYDRIVPPLELWLQAFNKAKYIFTDSFHGCVFSIIYNKDFIVYGNRGRGMSRFNSLMNLFDLQDRLIFNITDYSSLLVENRINWSLVNQKREDKKAESMLFLSKCFSR